MDRCGIPEITGPVVEVSHSTTISCVLSQRKF